MTHLWMWLWNLQVAVDWSWIEVERTRAQAQMPGPKLSYILQISQPHSTYWNALVGRDIKHSFGHWIRHWESICYCKVCLALAFLSLENWKKLLVIGGEVVVIDQSQAHMFITLSISATSSWFFNRNSSTDLHLVSSVIWWLIQLLSILAKFFQ